jgi:4'-phosphopantetheinyl transferase EntD
MPIYEIKNTSNYAKIGIWKITESTEDLIALLENKGFNTCTLLVTKNKQRLKQWLSTRLLLYYFYDNFEIIYDENGKPHLGNDHFISISHSHQFVAVSVNEKIDCGIDIEKLSPKVERIKHKFLNLIDLKNVTSLENLMIYWSAKEALYKYYGRKEVQFIENLFIENFDKNDDTFIGKIELPSFKIELPMVWKKIEKFVLVYTV